eukprot:GSChrysophyteH1.ASY1.ANO1.1031.1 assembled CDS
MSRSRKDGADWMKFTEVILTLGISVYLGYKMVSIAERTLKQTEEMKGGVNDSQQNAIRQRLSERLKRKDLGDLQLNTYEARLSNEVVSSSELGVSFSDIGGMDGELTEVRDNVVLPIQCWHQFGPKGTGKTLTARALACESGAADKLVSAVFSLARKIAPTIVFIDEVDTLMRKRENDQNGAITPPTNRPHDLDRAILRRMPVQIKMPMPNLQARVDILDKLLRSNGVYKEASLGELDAELDLQELSMRTEGYSGSDLREVVRVALLQRSKRALEESSRERKIARAVYEAEVQEWEAVGKPALVAADFDYALTKALATGAAASNYAMELNMDGMY